MPIWCPPTPPQDDSDVYIDCSLSNWYESTCMDEASLPPVFVRKELKRVHKEVAPIPADDGRRPPKIRKEETVYAPRSLFDRPSPALAKLRRDLKLQKFRGIVRPPVPLTNLSLKTPTLPARQIEEAENAPEWLIHEDWILLQAVQQLLELPLNLIVLTPAHTPNWDLVADMVNSYSRSYRSPKQCRNRYIGVILPREEGKAAVEASPKKIKKAKALVRAGQPPPLVPAKNSNRPMRTSQLFIADNNNSFSTVWHQKFEILKSIFQKKAPTNRSMLSSGAAGRSSSNGATNAKHAGVLLEAGISYDTPLNPVQVAAMRAERIAQKQKAAAAVAEQVQIQQQQQQQQQRLAPGTGGVVAGTPNSPITTARAATSASPSVNPMAVPTTPVVAGSTAGVTQHTLLLQGAAPTSVPTQQVVLQQGVTTIRTQRPIAEASPVRGVQQQQSTGAQQMLSASPGQTVVTVGNLTAVQVQNAAQMLASAGITVSGTGQLNTITTTAAGVKGASVTVVQTSGTTVVTPATAAGTKTLTPTQLQMFRQHALMKQQQQQRAAQDQQLKKLQLATGGGAVTQAGPIMAGGSTGPTQLTTVSGQKVALVSTTVSTIAGAGSSTLSTFTNVQIAGQPQTGATRTQLLKGGAAAAALLGKGGTLTRAIVTEKEMADLIKRQQIMQQQQKTANATAAAAAVAAAAANSAASSSGQQPTTVQIAGANSTGLTAAQFIAQGGIQVQTAQASGGQPQVATLVKTVSTPGNLGGAPSVTIPVSAINVGGLPQGVQVKGLTGTGVKATAATPQQLRQFTIHHQMLQQRKTQQQQQQPGKPGQMAQTVTLGTVKGNMVPGQQLSTSIGTVQLVQPVGTNTGGTGVNVVGTSSPGSSGAVVSKPGTQMTQTVTMQQLQQVIRQVTAGNAQVIVSSPSSGAGVSAGGILSKAPQGQTVQARMIPVTQQGLKQTIQVVTTGQPGSVGGTTRVATLSASATGNAMAPSLASALAAGTWKVAGGTDAQQKALLSQVSAALQSGHPVSLAVRAGPNAAGGPTRILTTATTFTTVTVASTTNAAVTATPATATVTTPCTTTTTVTTQPSIVNDSESSSVTDNS